MNADTSPSAHHKVRVLASVAGFHNERLISAIVMNVLTFLSPLRLALHTSMGSARVFNISNGTVTWCSSLQPYAAKLIANRVHVRVNHGSGDVLPIHLMNMALLLQSMMGRDDDRIVLMAGNQILFRPCSPIVRASPASLTLGSLFNDVLKGNFLPVGGWPNASSEIWRQQVADLVAGNDTYTRQEDSNGFTQNFLKFITSPKEQALVARTIDNEERKGRPDMEERQRTAALFQKHPVTTMIHEGSWYPVWFAAKALELVRHTHFDQHRWRTRSRCPYHGFPSPKKCTTEEQVLPTLAWQREPALVRASAGRPPLILRILQPPGMGKDEFAMQIEHVITQRDGSPTAYCGYKLVRDHRMHEATLYLLHRANRAQGVAARSGRADGGGRSMVTRGGKDITKRRGAHSAANKIH